MKQAIVTKYLGPTNRMCARVKAYCAAGSVTIPWDDESGTRENHECAAYRLFVKLEWHRKNRLVGGGLPNGEFVFVLEEMAPTHIAYGKGRERLGIEKLKRGRHTV